MAVNVFSASVPIEVARAGLDRVRADHEVDLGFPDEVLAEAQAAIAAYVLPELDLTDLEFVTLDPASSTDLDQAFRIERAGSGFRVRYAIADVPAFVALGGAIDAEARRRGATVYCPDVKASLHPPALADDAASLLPDQLRGAYVWSFDVDADGVATFAGLQRATIRSRAKLAYEQEQERLDAGVAAPAGGAAARGRASCASSRRSRAARSACPTSRRRCGSDGEGGFTLEYRVSVPIEDWNAQLSLMTGMAAAQDHARRRDRDPAHDAGAGRAGPAPGARQRPRPGDPLARRDALPRADPLAGRDQPAARGVPGQRHAPAAGRGLHGVRRRAPGAHDPLGDRRGVRPHDRAAAAAGRPVRACRCAWRWWRAARSTRRSGRRCRRSRT